ncbi:hypothetical protein PHYBOEH_010043 [Phytophthora boehmeriae]|uniref:RRM domain-containing protein n=1 Tax=Phytophthora boehmeriae TaxID=109152 RepID=A0A8T1X3E6_9STRA|nr:hypothetical protein PHYBOEH_010043 [Phytophthora boehmeriae]
MDAEGDGNAAPHRFEEQAADVAVKKEPPSPTTASAASDTRRSELSRLFIVCGRGRNVDDLRSLFSTCGAIKQLHLALDRSKKSRYEDPANARVAIEKLDQMKLDDGHILKVTIAKERPMNGNGKLKRNQHARQDLDGRADEDRQEDDGGIDARAPGKRQRSSPPAAALTLAPTGIRASPAFLLDNHCLERIAAAPLTTRLLETETTTNEWPALGNEALVNSNAVQKQQHNGITHTCIEYSISRLFAMVSTEEIS